VEHNADEWSKKRQRGDYEDEQLDLVQLIRELVNPDVLIGSRTLRDMETSPGVGRFGVMLPTLSTPATVIELSRSANGHLAEGGEKHLAHLDALNFTGNRVQCLEVVRPAFLEVRDPKRVVHPLRLRDLL